MLKFNQYFAFLYQILYNAIFYIQILPAIHRLRNAKITIGKNNFIMLCIMQTDIVSRRQGLSQKVFKLVHASLCLLADRSHRSDTPSVWLFSVILLFYNHR